MASDHPVQYPSYSINLISPSYGRSIGSGPSLYLSSHPRYPVSGVILHSPIASGLRLCDINVRNPS